MEIDWNEWEKESFDRAKKENKLVLLDIFGSWCYWCTRMDHDTYSDPDIIQLVNEKFVPIRVNTDKRPDINDRYNMGGWPTTAILSADGEVVTGGTYIPASQLYAILVRTHDLFSRDRERFERFLKDHEKIQRTSAKTKHIALEESLPLFDMVMQKSIDETYGGFGTAPKFPLPDAIEYCFVRGYTEKKKELTDFAKNNLNAITEIFDPVEGGFFRYATQPDWKAPHFEKMLEGNARLLRNYVMGYQITKNAEYKKIAEHTIQYMQQTLSHEKERWFFGSQQADEAYYALDKKKRAEGRKPGVDATLYTNLNCLAIQAFFEAGTILGLPKIIEHAETALAFVTKNCVSEKRGTFHYWDGTGHGTELLTDNTEFVHALLAGYTATGNKEYAQQAQQQVKWILETFWDEKKKGCVDSIVKKHIIGKLHDTRIALQENIRLAQALGIVAGITKNQTYAKKAETILTTLQGEAEFQGLLGAGFGTTVIQLNTPITITVRGNQEFFMKTLQLFEPRAVRIFETADSNQIEVCKGTKCLQPVKTSIELQKQLEEKA